MEKELISVIVPIYNVEKYIARCLDSLISQTHSNIQIIVVNDGTLDKSREIVEKYKTDDKRIEIYDKGNGGLSDARNYGLKHVRGKYVCFVDSDDWVSNDYIETLYSIFRENVNITCGGFEYFYDNGKTEIKECMRKTVLSNAAAMQALCEGKWMTNHVWNKMYRVQLFENIQFEVGRHFEDIYIMHQLFAKATQIICTDKIIYHYFMRGESIIHQKNAQNDMDIFIGYCRRYEFLQDRKLKRIVLKYCAWACYKSLYLTKSEYVNEEDLRVARKFWKKHKDIDKLGIKYFFMHKYPEIYRKLLAVKE